MRWLPVIGYRLSVWERMNGRVSDRQPSTGNRQLVVIALLIALAMPAIANACPVCFGDPNAPMNKGTANAIWFLLGIVGVVQAAFIALFVTFWRRAREAKKFREQFRLMDGGVE